jgi:hypothetical protein
MSGPPDETGFRLRARELGERARTFVEEELAHATDEERTLVRNALDGVATSARLLALIAERCREIGDVGAANMFHGFAVATAAYEADEGRQP